MREVKIHPIEPAYTKENGLFVFRIDQYDVNANFPVRERSVVHIPAGQIGGNHSHPRAEAFVAMGHSATLHWIDDDEKLHVEKLCESGKLFIAVVSPHTPHAVRSNSSEQPLTLIEYASASQTPEEVTRCSVIE